MFSRMVPSKRVGSASIQNMILFIVSFSSSSISLSNIAILESSALSLCMMFVISSKIVDLPPPSNPNIPIEAPSLALKLIFLRIGWYPRVRLTFLKIIGIFSSSPTPSLSLNFKSSDFGSFLSLDFCRSSWERNILIKLFRKVIEAKTSNGKVMRYIMNL